MALSEKNDKNNKLSPASTQMLMIMILPDVKKRIQHLNLDIFVSEKKNKCNILSVIKL